MSSHQAAPNTSALSSKDRFLHVKSIDVTFPAQRPTSTLEMKLKCASLKHKSPEIQVAGSLHWDCEVYVEASTTILLIVQKTGLIRRSSDIVASFPLDFQSAKFADDMSIELKDGASGATATIILGDAKSTSDVTRLLANKAKMALATKINMLERLGQVLGCLKLAVDMGKDAAQLYPPLQIAVPVVTRALELQKLQEIPDCHHELTRIMDDAASVVPSVELALKHAQIVQVRQPINDYFDIVRDLSEKILEEYSSPNSKFILRSLFKSGKYDTNELRQRMTTLKDNIDLALSAHIQQGVAEILEHHQHFLSEADEKLLERLKPPAYSSYDTDRCCLLGTRDSVIQEMVTWSRSTDTPSRLFWLHGVAGCGKSSVATSVARTLDKLEFQDVLSYSFFCKRDDPERRDAIRIIQAIAYYLSSAFEPYRVVLLRKLKKKPTLLENAIYNQHEALLVDCIKEMSGATPRGPIIITLDALDECDDNEKVSKLLVNIIRSVSWIKLIVTSRPLQSIQENLESSGTLLSPYDLFRTPTTEDILIYTKHQFEDGGKLAILRKYVTPADIEELARKALGLFIWITVVCSYVSQRKSERLSRFKAVIQSTNAPDSEKQLDELYLQVLNYAAGSTETGAGKADIRLITAIVLATSRNRALPAEALFAFGSPEYRGLPEEWQDLLQDLRSVLITDTQTNAIRVCHKSFLDFLGSQERSGEFWTESSELEQLMARKCLSIMLAPSGLKFNICNLETSYLPNRDVKELGIDQHIPRELQYSCLYWFDHLSWCGAEFASQVSMQHMLHELFCQVKSLYWLEVLSLLSELREAVVILQGFKELLKHSQSWSDKDELYSVANDLYRFVKAYHEPMALSTPHLYISALIWAPSESLIAKSMGPTFNSRACLLDGHSRTWPTNIQTLLVNSRVQYVVYSPDGRRIISGSDDGTVRIWDAESGAPAGEPLRGHSDAVRSVNYSSDGRHIVSGSDDCTIRIWDVETGVSTGEPIRGHDKPVLSVNYSPDRRHIVSGSGDCTIRIWDAETGEPTSKPLHGHEKSVVSVNYSPDGHHIVSGSDDCTVRIWDAETHTPVGRPIRGHEKSVNSINYSPDGRHIVSGSDDGTIRIWDAETGARVVEPLQGHKKSVVSVNYSPDGHRIVSGSDDCTIRVWDAETYTPVGPPLLGHEKSINSINYSPDGRRIVSGLDDGTIRIWDAEIRSPIIEPPRGHLGWVYSVSYSPDGCRIASGSYDGTIRIWDAEIGTLISAPLRGHHGPVHSVDYSPDGRHIVSASRDGTIRIWDAEAGVTVGEPLRGHHGWIYSVSYSPDGRSIVSGSDDGTIRMWDSETGTSIGEPLVGHHSWVYAVGYSPDGRRIVAAFHDGTIQVWDIETGTPVSDPLQVHRGWSYTVKYSPDGCRIVSGFDDGSIRIWDVETGRLISESSHHHRSSVRSICYSSDGRRIVSGSDDGTIQFWDAETGTPLSEPLRGHHGSVRSVNYSPDGRHIVSGSDDSTIRIWDAQLDAPLTSQLRHHEEADGFVCTTGTQADSAYMPRDHVSHDISSWEEGQWKYCLHEACFVSRSPEAPGLIVRSRSPRWVPPDGWIRTTNDGLFLWIPYEHRDAVCDMSLFCVPRNSIGHAVRIDWTKLRYGADWSTVKVEE